MQKGAVKDCKAGSHSALIGRFLLGADEMPRRLVQQHLILPRQNRGLIRSGELPRRGVRRPGRLPWSCRNKGRNIEPGAQVAGSTGKPSSLPTAVCLCDSLGSPHASGQGRGE